MVSKMNSFGLKTVKMEWPLFWVTLLTALWTNGNAVKHVLTGPFDGESLSLIYYTKNVLPQYVSLGWKIESGFVDYCAGAIVQIGKVKMIVTSAYCAHRVEWESKREHVEKFSLFDNGQLVPILNANFPEDWKHWYVSGKTERTKHNIAVFQLDLSDHDQNVHQLPHGFSLPMDGNTHETNGKVCQLQNNPESGNFTLETPSAKLLSPETCTRNLAKMQEHDVMNGKWLCLELDQRGLIEEGSAYFKGKTLLGVFDAFYKKSSLPIYTDVSSYGQWIISLGTPGQQNNPKQSSTVKKRKKFEDNSKRPKKAPVD